MDDTPQIRKPILDRESDIFPDRKIEQEWKILTEVIRRGVLDNPEIRKIVASKVDAPLTESLPNELLEALSFDEGITELQRRFQSEIGDFLALDTVPDEHITPDITHARWFINLESMIQSLQERFGNDTEEFNTEFKKYLEKQGITGEERRMIAKRYRFSRDVKLLALAAEILEQGDTFQRESSEEIRLPSGTHIAINPEFQESLATLINPQNWIRRRQIKDRVYEVQIGEEKYILKEQKTARHINTKNRGHKPGLSSLEEFQTALYFQEHGVQEKARVKVNWEKPIAVVTFPDGFQFALFTHEKDLARSTSITDILAEGIRKHKKQFIAEFKQIRQLSQKYIQDSRIQGAIKKKKKLWWEAWKSDFPFEDFARIKAIRMMQQANNFFFRIILENGYEDKDDNPDFSYRVNTENDKVQLEIIGFDFEYFSKLSPEEVERRLKIQLENEDLYEKREGCSGYGSFTREQQAAYLALLEIEGVI